jgi:hypothetical protein
MREPVFFTLNGLFPKAAIHLLPGLERAAEELGAHFDVVFDDPSWVIGSATAEDSDRGQILRDGVAGRHVLTMDATVEPFLFFTQGEGVKSLVTAGSVFTSANRWALGMPHTATGEAYDGTRVGFDTTYHVLRLYTRGASDDFQRELAAYIDPLIDWDRFRDTVSLHNPEAYLLGELKLDVPTLYLRSNFDFLGTEDAMRRLFTNLEVDRLHDWPVHLHEEKAGIELASKVIPFIEKHANRHA